MMDYKSNRNTVGCATTNKCYNEEFLSIKSGCYNDKGVPMNAEEYYLLWKVRLLFSLGKRLFMLFMCVRSFMNF